jgi:Flp pilus assembly protein TadG
MKSARAADSRRRERGATAVVVAVMVTALFGILGLALNVGHLMSVRSELQTAADSAALAAGQQLAVIVDPTTGYPDMTKIADVTTQATTYSANNPSDKLALSINAGDVVVGVWDPSTSTFTASNVNTQVNAVKVTVSRASAGAATGPVDMVFGSLLGWGATRNVQASAVAYVSGPPPISAPTMPIAIVTCGSINALCGTQIFVNIDNSSTNGFWTDYDLGNGNPNILNILQWVPGDASLFPPGWSANVGDCTVNKVPGVRNVDLNYIQSNDIGKLFEVPVVCTTCANGDSQIRSFVIVKVLSTTTTGNSKGITVQISCGDVTMSGFTSGSGGPASPSWNPRPRLVQ